MIIFHVHHSVLYHIKTHRGFFEAFEDLVTLEKERGFDVESHFFSVTTLDARQNNLLCLSRVCLLMVVNASDLSLQLILIFDFSINI